jgi:NADH dehydrogenase FAD-containing subunit
VIVLGSGWASVSFIKALPKSIADKYEVILMSPRNYFLYTPLLPAVATGTMEERSIVEPVRNLLGGKVSEVLCCCVLCGSRGIGVVRVGLSCVLLSVRVGRPALSFHTHTHTHTSKHPPQKKQNIKQQAEYYEAVAKVVDPVKRELVACFPADAGLDEACFKISYDVLVVGVGSVNNTFGIEGVDKYCMYFKVE